MYKMGIIGAGQLSMMLCEAAKKQNLKTKVLGSKADPAATVADEVIPADQASLTDFLSDCQFGTIESEFVSFDAIEEALNKSATRIHFHPLPKSIRIAQDKLSQKELFSRLHVPTAKHRTLSEVPTEEELLDLFDWNPAGTVLKWSKFGYDGKGNFVFKDKEQIKKAIEFCKEAKNKKARVYAETLVSFEHELAMIFIRTPRGDVTYYPMVISEQMNGACKVVYGPATKLGIPHKAESQAIEIGKAIGDTLLLTGVYAIEFFYSSQQGLLVNEMAPRVHNSGHFTQHAADFSQFDNHVRVVSGQKPFDTKTRPFFGMLNLLGPEGQSKSLPQNQQLPRPLVRDSHLYWYGKTELKPWRKMGHINFWTDRKEDLFASLEQLKQFERQLWKDLE